MSDHVFKREVDLLERLESSIDVDGLSATEAKEFLKEYGKLLKQTQRIVRISDRSEEKLRAANTIISSQKTELETAHQQLSDRASALRQEVNQQTANLKLSQLKLEKLVNSGLALSAEADEKHLLELIVKSAMEIANADGGTLYLREDNKLTFEVLRTSSLDIALGGATGSPITLPPVFLEDPETGDANYSNVASASTLLAETILIDDAYEDQRFDFSGTRAFDDKTGYRSQSFLTVPLKPRGKGVIGVLQLLNAKDQTSGQTVPFDDEVVSFVEALSSQAAIAIDNQTLIEAQKEMLDSFIELIAGAIDAKSAYTGGHCNRVPEIAIMLASAAEKQQDGPFKDFAFANEDAWREFRIAAWLHDCGKVTTPEYVVDKATKLETIHNRISEIRTRFEILLRDAEIAYLTPGSGMSAQDLEVRKQEIHDAFAFIAECNVGGEFMSEDRMSRVKEIAEMTWTRHLSDRIGLSAIELERFGGEPEPVLPVQEHVLADKPEHVIHRDDPNPFADNPHGFDMVVPEHLYNYGEVYNLCIAKGTLTAEERFKINDHIVQTINMLSEIPYPPHLAQVPEIAGNHHETMIGTGYPRKLVKEEMSMPSRIMAIADIFEALTASDRPYKPAKTLSESIRIMGFMRKDQHIDSDLFELFLESGVYREYAEKFLKPEQIDAVDVESYLA